MLSSGCVSASDLADLLVATMHAFRLEMGRKLSLTHAFWILDNIEQDYQPNPASYSLAYPTQDDRQVHTRRVLQRSRAIAESRDVPTRVRLDLSSPNSYDYLFKVRKTVHSCRISV